MGEAVKVEVLQAEETPDSKALDKQGVEEGEEGQGDHAAYAPHIASTSLLMRAVLCIGRLRPCLKLPSNSGTQPVAQHQNKLFEQNDLLPGYQLHPLFCFSAKMCQPQDTVCACSGSDSIEAYVSPAMLQDPWAKLMQQHLHHMAESEPVPADALEHNGSVNGQPGQSLADVFAAAELVRFCIDTPAFLCFAVCNYCMQASLADA